MTIRINGPVEIRVGPPDLPADHAPTPAEMADWPAFPPRDPTYEAQVREHMRILEARMAHFVLHVDPPRPQPDCPSCITPATRALLARHLEETRP